MNPTLLMQIIILINAVILGAVITLLIQYARSHTKHQRGQHVLPTPTLDSVQLDPSLRQKMLQEAEHHFQSVLTKSIASLETDLATTTTKLREQLEKFGHAAEQEEAERYNKTLDELHDQARSLLGGAQTAIASHQASLTKGLTTRQAELEEELEDRIHELEEELVARQAQLQTELNERQAELEATLAKHHAELRVGFSERQEKIEAELNRHQTELEAALKEREVSLTKVQTELDAELSSRRQKLEAELDKEMQAKRAFVVEYLNTKLSDAVTSFLMEALQHNVDLGAQAPYLTALLEEHKDELIEGVRRDPVA